jgi:hypothetical protein
LATLPQPPRQIECAFLDHCTPTPILVAIDCFNSQRVDPIIPVSLNVLFLMSLEEIALRYLFHPQQTNTPSLQLRQSHHFPRCTLKPQLRPDAPSRHMTCSFSQGPDYSIASRNGSIEHVRPCDRIPWRERIPWPVRQSRRIPTIHCRHALLS